MVKEKLDVFMTEILTSLERLTTNNKHVQDEIIRASLNEVNSVCRNVYLVLDEMARKLKQLEKGAK